MKLEDALDKLMGSARLQVRTIVKNNFLALPFFNRAIMIKSFKCLLCASWNFFICNVAFSFKWRLLYVHLEKYIREKRFILKKYYHFTQCLYLREILKHQAKIMSPMT